MSRYAQSNHLLISVVIPIYNEEKAIPVFLTRITSIINSSKYAFELIFVDDGSSDTSVELLIREQYSRPEIKVIELSRNFGKEAALTAGLTYATGQAVIPMDVDLQDPPEVILELIKRWEEGYKVVNAIRRDRQTDSWLKRSTASYFYRLMSNISDTNIPLNGGDFRLMDRSVVEAILSYPERNRFMKGIMAAAGFKSASVEYDREIRSAGETKFNFWRLWNFALDGITGFSTVPLRVWTYIGIIVAAISFFYGCWIIAKTLIWGVVTPGFATLTSVVLFLGGIQLIGIGVLGEYIGRIYAETKQRPIFLISQLHGIGSDVNKSVYLAVKNRKP